MGSYVDTVRSYPGAGLRFTEFCHLLADDRDELHAIAARLGMPRRFFQDHPWRWHYDLPAHLRADAVRFGAHEVDLAMVGRLLRARRVAFLKDAPAGADPAVESVADPGANPAVGSVAEPAVDLEPGE